MTSFAMTRIDLRGRTLSTAELRTALPRGGVDVDAIVPTVRPIVDDVALELDVHEEGRRHQLEHLFAKTEQNVPNKNLSKAIRVKNFIGGFLQYVAHHAVFIDCVDDVCVTEVVAQIAGFV